MMTSQREVELNDDVIRRVIHVSKDTYQTGMGMNHPVCLMTS